MRANSTTSPAKESSLTVTAHIHPVLRKRNRPSGFPPHAVGEGAGGGHWAMTSSCHPHLDLPHRGGGRRARPTVFFDSLPTPWGRARWGGFGKMTSGCHPHLNPCPSRGKQKASADRSSRRPSSLEKPRKTRKTRKNVTEIDISCAQFSCFWCISWLIVNSQLEESQ